MVCSQCDGAGSTSVYWPNANEFTGRKPRTDVRIVYAKGTGRRGVYEGNPVSTESFYRGLVPIKPLIKKVEGKRMTQAAKEVRYVSRGSRDGWYGLTFSGWFPPEKNDRPGFVVSRGHGGLTFRDVKTILFFLRGFVSETFGSGLRDEFLSKIQAAEKQLYQIREETKGTKYLNEFSARDDGY